MYCGLTLIGIVLGVDLDEANDKQNLTFSRRYLDPNRVTYEVSLFHPYP